MVSLHNMNASLHHLHFIFYSGAGLAGTCNRGLRGANNCMILIHSGTPTGKSISSSISTTGKASSCSPRND